MTIFLYVFYHIIILLFIILCSIRISKTSSKRYWSYAFIPITIYAIEEGMRWGRSSDWPNYLEVYNQIGHGDRQEFEILFYVFWRLFSFTGLPYPFVITACSFLLIFSLFYFSKDYKRYLWLLIPLLVVWISPKSIQFVRWFIGYSVFIIGYTKFLNQKRVIPLVIMISSIFFHYGLVLFVFFAFIVSYIKTPLLRPIYPIIGSLLLILIFNIELLQNLTMLSQVFLHSGTERFDEYTKNPEYWLQANFETKSKVWYIINMLPLYSYLWIFYKCLDSRKMVVFYNIAIVGLILRSISSGIEIMDRYAICFDAFFVIASVVSFCYLREQYHKGILRTILLLIFTISFVTQSYKFCKTLEDEKQMHYYWETDLPSVNSVWNSYK